MATVFGEEILAKAKAQMSKAQFSMGISEWVAAETLVAIPRQEAINLL
jgi:hypothetical protein